MKLPIDPSQGGGGAAIAAFFLFVSSTLLNAEALSTSSRASKGLLEARERSVTEERSQFEHWCNGTLAAQAGRREALQRLFSQAQQSSQSPAPLARLQSEVAALGDELERQRVSVQAVQHERAQTFNAAQLDAQDASRDADALRQAGKLAGSMLPPVMKKLQPDAEALAHTLESKVNLLQTQPQTNQDEQKLSQLEADYADKKTSLAQLRHQDLTTQRSLEVLMSAIEDESAYLADLQVICSMEHQVYDRLQQETVPELRTALAGAEPESAPAPPSLAAALSALPAVPAVPAVAPMAAAAPKVEAQKATTPAPTASDDMPLAAAVPTAPPKLLAHKKTVVHKKVAAHKKAAVVVATTPAPPAASDDDDAPLAAAATTAAPTVAPTVAPVLVAHTSKKVAHKKAAHKKAVVVTTPAPPASDDDDDAALMAAPVTTAAPTVSPVLVAHKSKKAAHKKAAHKKAAHKKAVVVTTPAPPAADDDDDVPLAAAATTAAPTVAPLLVAHKPKAAPKKTADPFADDDDAPLDADVPAATKLASHESKKKAKKAKKAEADDDLSLDDDASADAPVAPKPHKKAAHKKAAAATTPAPSADDDDTPLAADPPAAPKLVAKKSKKAEKKDDDVTLDDDDLADEKAMEAAPKPSLRASKKKVAEKKAPVEDDLAADDDAPLAAKPSKKHVAAAAAPVDDDAAPADDVVAEPPAHLKHKKKAGKPKKANFMDTVYTSAAGTMPDQYKAWTPDGGASASKAPSKEASNAAADGAKAKDRMAAMLGSMDDDSDSFDTAALVASAKKTSAGAKASAAAAAPAAPEPKVESTTAAPVALAAKHDAADDDSQTDAMPAKAESTTKAPSAAHSDSDADSDDDLSSKLDAKLDAPAPKHDDPPAVVAAVAKKHRSDDDEPAPAAKASKDDFDSDSSAAKSDFGDDDDAPPPPRHHSHDSDSLVQKAAAPKKRAAPTTTAAPAPGNLPGQYSTWTPADSGSAEEKKKAALAQMEADFDDDDDGPTTRAPRRHHHAPTTTPAPVVKSADGVEYDDDDLPKHNHRSITAELQGGWQSLMKKKKHGAHKPKLDPDIAIMESLYSSDGGLPTQYTAWSPESAAPAPAAPALAQTSSKGEDKDLGQDGGKIDLAAVAKEFEKDPDGALDFMQVSMFATNAGLDQRHQIQHAIMAAARGSVGPISLIEESLRTDSSHVFTANVLLEQYAQVLQSKPLKQLAQAKLSPQKLESLWEHLQAVDPLTHPGAIPAHGRQAQAEQWCLYFQKNAQSAVPVNKAAAVVEQASNELAEQESQHSALEEEVDARSQLQKTVEQDVQSLTTLLNVAKAGMKVSDVTSMEKQVAKAANQVALGEAAQGFKAGHAELADALEGALRERTAVLEAQHKKLDELNAMLKESAAARAEKQTKAVQSQAAMEAARKKIASVQASCDATLGQVERRRHDGHMEAHAVEVALKVLRGD